MISKAFCNNSHISSPEVSPFSFPLVVFLFCPQSFWMNCCALHHPPLHHLLWTQFEHNLKFYGKTSFSFHCVVIQETCLYTKHLYCVSVVCVGSLYTLNTASLWWQHETWLQAREGLGGFGKVVQLLHFGQWAHQAVYGKEVCYQHQLWTFCMVGLVLDYLRKPCCRFLYID